MFVVGDVIVVVCVVVVVMMVVVVVGVQEDVVGDVVVVVCCGHDNDDNRAISRCFGVGGLCFCMVRDIGTVMSLRLWSQERCFRDNHMAYEHIALTSDNCLQIRIAFEYE